MCPQTQDFRDFKTRKLSASDSGRGVKVATTSAPGTLVHQALGSIAASEWDAVWLSAVNASGSAVKLTLLWGGTAAVDDEIEITIPAESGLVPIIEGLVLQNSREVRAFAATANTIVLHGYVHRYEQS